MEVGTTEVANPGGENPLQVPPPAVEPKVEKTPDQKMVDILSPFGFLRYNNGTVDVNHEECKAILQLKRLKMGDLVRRGNILTSLNGGSTNVDEQTTTLNNMLATIQVGFENLKLDLLDVTDTQLIIGLYTAVSSYNSFFRKTPLGLIL